MLRQSSAGLRPADNRGWLSLHCSFEAEAFMTNDELIRAFETDSLPENSFHHADHVRLAFAYLSQFSVLQALEQFAGALKGFAAARGQSQLYNETIRTLIFF
jgi:hypothetical protein